MRSVSSVLSCPLTIKVEAAQTRPSPSCRCTGVFLKTPKCDLWLRSESQAADIASPFGLLQARECLLCKCYL